MAFLKKTAIKRMTNKRATMLFNGMVETLNAYPNIEPKEALITYIKDMLLMGGMTLDQNEYTSFFLEGFDKLIEKAEHDKEVTWVEYLTYWTTELVFSELSYDRTIGTEQEDYRIVFNVVRNLVKNWTT